MSPPKPTIWVVDDEPDVLDGVALLLRSAGFSVVPCGSGDELLERVDENASGCILLDLRMPGRSGLEVQRELRRRGIGLPIVFLSGHGDIPIAVRAMRAGAVDFLEKPAREHVLLATVQRALDVGAERRARETARLETEAKLESLSPREAEVADLVLAGLRSAEIAERLGLSPRTVEMHRGRLLKRLGARTTAEAAAIIQKARVQSGREPDGER